MAIFIFNKGDNTALYKIAENLNEIQNLNIIVDHYDLIEDNNSQNFLDVKLNKKIVIKHENNSIVYQTPEIGWKFLNKNQLDVHITSIKNQIKLFLDKNENNPLFLKWNNYYNQLSSLNTDSINYPLNMSLEEYFYDSNLPALNTLQLP
jgi:hypothetical protein